MKRVAFLVQLPKGVSPGQRFRIEQFESYLINSGVSFDTFPFLDNSTYQVWYHKGSFARKVFGLLSGIGRCCLFVLKAGHYDFIFVQRGLMPLGPPVFEWLLSKVLGKKLILDFDDAIWMPDPSREKLLYRFVKQYGKTRQIARWSYKVSVGNRFLQQFALQHNKNVVLLPTCVDTELRYNRMKQPSSGIPVIGWTGSHSTLAYLELLVPVLQRLEQKYEFAFLVICDRKPDLPIRSLHFSAWRTESEIEDLLRIDIGVMPLTADTWSEGKCGFKLIQYLSLGIPAVASRVGVNKEIITDGTTGYLCDTHDAWYLALESLLLDNEMRARMGIAGRKRIEDDYSVRTIFPGFLDLFN